MEDRTPRSSGETEEEKKNRRKLNLDRDKQTNTDHGGM